MSQKENNWTRRNFLKTAGIAGAATIITPLEQLAHSAEKPLLVPTRPFGKTGRKVSILSLGGSIDILSNQLILKQAFKHGVTYWDTAHSYNRGNSEKGIGKYLGKYPEDRKKIFLVTKSGAWTIKGMTNDFNKSLERMKTDYIDLFFVHRVNSINEMDSDIKAWAEKKKKEGKIYFFGFSSHSNMEECLLDASGLGWIDGIMMTYNYRLMHTDRMKRAVDACFKAGIGLTAMKTQGGGQVKTGTKIELRLAGRFLKKGFTDAQAKLKAVWENPQIASICSRMPNMTYLMSNIAAAMDKTRLSAQDIEFLKQYAHETAADYCTGCTNICEPVLTDHVPIGDVMRYLMYSRSYGDRDNAAGLNKIPEKIRERMAGLDYSSAEERCPRRMAIGRLMREAAEELL